MAITLPDARQLPDEVLQELRLRALRGCEMGFSQSDVAEMLGFARETVSRLWSAYQSKGLDGLPDDRTGRPLGSGRTLSEEQGVHIQQLIDENSPQQLGIAAPLWSRKAVRDLIHKEYGIWMPVRTVGEYLKRWGYTAKRPQRHANDQDPEEVREWLEETYPEIERRAREENPEPAGDNLALPQAADLEPPSKQAGPLPPEAAQAQPQGATIKVFDPIRVPANDPIFDEADPAARAKLTPKVWFPSAHVEAQAGQQGAVSPGAASAPAAAPSEAQARQQQTQSSDTAQAVPQPAPAKQEERRGAEIDFVDEAGVAADEHPRYGYARKGERATMEVPKSHIRVNTVATVNNKGEIHYMTYTGMMNAALFITFLEQLLSETTRKIFLIADRLSAHDCAEVEKWVLPRMDQIEVYFLPVRAPELNPVEYCNNDTKGNVHAAGLPNNKAELQSSVQSFLNKLAELPQRVRSYFQHPCVQYAAGY